MKSRLNPLREWLPRRLKPTVEKKDHSETRSLAREILFFAEEEETGWKSDKEQWERRFFWALREPSNIPRDFGIKRTHLLSIIVLNEYSFFFFRTSVSDQGMTPDKMLRQRKQHLLQTATKFRGHLWLE